MNHEQEALSIFEWNEDKRRTSLEKHQIDFEDVVFALQEPRLELRSDRNGEVRILAICPNTERLIAVV
ncbi:BrnT family toxin [Rhizobium sp. YS-1r]|uniref:BrnT family toxin n=1 Tax=Rhizobium sp. YS-1r TaxID=1532558 RepID=UPI0032980DAC